MKKYLDTVTGLPGFSQICESLEKTGTNVYVTGCGETQRFHLSESIKSRPVHLIITENESRAARIMADCSFFGANCIYYPAKDMIFYSADLHGNQIIARRLTCISELIKSISKDKEITVVTTLDAFSDRLLPLEKYTSNTILLKNGDEPEKPDRELVRIGYEKKDMAILPGQFARRGGILDIYPVNAQNPVRIEFWGDEIDSIRVFDADSQRSIEKLSKVEIFPATEYILDEEQIEKGLKKIRKDVEARLDELGDNEKRKTPETYEACNRLRKAITDLERIGDYEKYISYFEKKCVSFTDYFPPEKTLVIFDEPAVLEEGYRIQEEEYRESTSYRFEKGYILKKQTDLFRSLSGVYKLMDPFSCLMLSLFGNSLKGMKPDVNVHLTTSSINAYNNSFETLVKDIKHYKEQKYSTVLVTGSVSRRNRIKKDLEEFGIEAFTGKDKDFVQAPGTVYVTEGSISRGFTYPEIKFCIITENDIFVRSSRKRKEKSRKRVPFSELNIKPGDFVVHENYGIGIYRGIEKKSVDDTEKDYIKIEYADGANVFIQATHTDVIQRYASSDTENKPKINKLGTAVWGKTKAKAKEAVQQVAADLVRLYAARAGMKGFSFSKDTVWQSEFEEMFPYQETSDQLDAISDVKRDMESERIMDRLICGDVGFGKTEVALRAAFKAVQDGKQVAFLTPTTILAGQHFDTFTERLRSFPVNVELMSGMRSSSYNKKTEEQLKKGLVDIVIGTHRILSKNVEFKDLGLLIIDEEQRFGVNHKEKIKKLKENIDVIALSATPIPRTLNMSLAGIRDMSTLEEPPTERLPIQTFVSEQDDGIIREAIKREMSRGGQVYYVYNRINRMDEIKARLEKLLPEAVTVCVHGRMDKRELERIMVEFINGEIDVLISTTIIETGLDIPNVNTIIIEDADKLGLSQLYQLRGRVGRSHRSSYAFLLYRRDKIITEVAMKRLSAISEMTELGSGYRLAMKDLEIRGAGTMLGKTQHGHMNAVGFELYTKLLNEAVAKEKGQEIPAKTETSVDIIADAFLSDEYIPREIQKLDLYKRIAAITSRADIEDMEAELEDRYGPLPEPAHNLLKMAYIKAMAGNLGILQIKGAKKNGEWIARFEYNSESDADVQDTEENLIVLKTGETPVILWRPAIGKTAGAPEFLDLMIDFFEKQEG